MNAQRIRVFVSLLVITLLLFGALFCPVASASVQSCAMIKDCNGIKASCCCKGATGADQNGMNPVVPPTINKFDQVFYLPVAATVAEASQSPLQFASAQSSSRRSSQPLFLLHCLFLI